MKWERIAIGTHRPQDAALVDPLIASLEQALGGDRFVRPPHVPFDEDRWSFLDHLRTCDVFLVPVGPGWTAQLRMLDKPDDPVRAELELVLQRPDVLIIPLLIGVAGPPGADKLPAFLKGLAQLRPFALPLGVEGPEMDALRDLLAHPPQALAMPRFSDPDRGMRKAIFRVRSKRNSALRMKKGPQDTPAAEKPVAPFGGKAEDFGAGGDVTPAAVPLPKEDVEGRIFSRERVKPGKISMVRVYLHLPDQLELVRAMARKADDKAREQSSVALTEALARGDRLRVCLEIAGAALPQPVQDLVWQGKPVAASFAFTAPAAGFEELYAEVSVYLNDVPLGRAGWVIGEETDQQASARPTDGEAEVARLTRYKRAFLSYSSKDRIRVLETAQMLRALKIGFFQDVLMLEPGDRFAQVLESEASRCDLFLLFWSQNAAKSQWVVREAEWALARRDSSADHMPDLRVIILDGPPPADPPESLRSSLHMNDVISYVIAAEKAARKGKDPAG